MSGGRAAQLTKIANLLHRHVRVAGEMKQRVKQHGAVAGGEHKTVAVGPVGRGRVEFEIAAEQHRRHVGHAHGHAGMAAVRGLNRIHGQGANRVGHGLFRDRRRCVVVHVRLAPVAARRGMVHAARTMAFACLIVNRFSAFATSRDGGRSSGRMSDLRFHAFVAPCPGLTPDRGHRCQQGLATSGRAVQGRSFATGGSPWSMRRESWTSGMPRGRNPSNILFRNRRTSGPSVNASPGEKLREVTARRIGRAASSAPEAGRHRARSFFPPEADRQLSRTGRRLPALLPSSCLPGRQKHFGRNLTAHCPLVEGRIPACQATWQKVAGFVSVRRQFNKRCAGGASPSCSMRKGCRRSTGKARAALPAACRRRNPTGRRRSDP